jgi:hypothetical protein
MRARLLIVFCVLTFVALSFVMPAPAQDKAKKPNEDFFALAYLPSGGGPAMIGAGAKVNVDLKVNGYTSDADAKVMGAALVNEGPSALLKLLEKAKTIGKIRLTGRAGYYDFKLIRSHRIEGGRRIYAVGDRPVGFLEAYVGNRSQDYPFGILQMDLKTNSKGKEEGTGSLIYAARIKVLEGKSIDVETYGIEPIRLMGLRKH